MTRRNTSMNLKLYIKKFVQKDNSGVYNIQRLFRSRLGALNFRPAADRQPLSPRGKTRREGSAAERLIHALNIMLETQRICLNSSENYMN